MGSLWLEVMCTTSEQEAAMVHKPSQALTVTSKGVPSDCGSGVPILPEAVPGGSLGFRSGEECGDLLLNSEWQVIQFVEADRNEPALVRWRASRCSWCRES